MISPSNPGDPAGCAKPLTETKPSSHVVIVPVFLKITVEADDPLHAECKAVEVARSISRVNMSGSGVCGEVRVHSVIAPQTVPKSMQ